MLNTTPADWVTDETVTATKMNTEIRDALTDLQAAWSSYTVTWTGSGSNPSIGNGALAGIYTRIGRTVFGRIKLFAGSTTSFGSGVLRFSLPVAPHSDYYQTAYLAPVGNAGLYDASSDRRFRNVVIASSTYFDLRTDENTSVTGTVPWTWANGDGILASFRYEAAS